MEKYYSRKKEFEKDRDVYVPVWVQTLIDLYTSPLKDEVMYGTKDDKAY